ncbi:MAG: hypothetical protein NTU49_03490, partial [Gammaproteobacteria bacterium]|nr:hypothetical protein [Gammaproteobacteria bacterium]
RHSWVFEYNLGLNQAQNRLKFENTGVRKVKKQSLIVLHWNNQHFSPKLYQMVLSEAGPQDCPE